jgi:hypothetical protein
MRRMLLMIMVVLACIGFAYADEYDEKVNTILKVLNYDRSIGTRNSQGVRISIVYNNTSSKSTQEAVAMSGALSKVKGATVQGHPVNNSIDLFATDLRDKLSGYAAIYVCSDVDIGEVLKVSSDKKILTFGSNDKYWKKVSVLLVKDGTTIKIHLRDPQLQKEGANIAAELKSISVMD